MANITRYQVEKRVFDLHHMTYMIKRLFLTLTVLMMSTGPPAQDQ